MGGYSLMSRGKTFDNIARAIGDTPMVQINRLVPSGDATVFAKCEFFQPLNSVKDRIGVAMIEAGERDGSINPDTHIIEPTSGNTGIALAFVCAAKGYKLTLTMPESMSVERRALLRAMGANLVLTPAGDGMKGAITTAQELVDQTDNSFMPQQFENPSNPAIHEATTGPEIWADTDGKIDAIVAGVGTGGTITGVARYLKKQNPDFKAFAVEPKHSPVISGGSPGKHRIQGIGAGFIPGNLDTSIIDDVVQVDDEDAFEWGRQLAKQEGIVAGISSGANMWAAAQIAARPEMKGKRIVTVMCSLGERYLSTPLFGDLGL
ncbi:cysteine synthase A [Rhodopirellula baltica]|uniref:cysteine synthase n=4 Tax=Rhodopirellula baltica TaxID=265606 RepID=Q7UPH6_RHOBA|nr:cysteine synthase A [Rhodopirellula baltica]EGF29805.1 cysteine synthase A [Rhodopirellula baltica WH47]EKK02518.1 cysteine synthase A [Rhodopirellula baltica SH28]ELP35090.1 cysteine synthase A [Rhodopirellula baltica SWK14]CAD75086.1 cysteine synthase (O-acetylserine sulfhydrylase) [Rhodopirellula baltica SH 1]